MADSPALKTAEPGLRQRQKARRRENILTAARLLFFRQGYNATSMEAVAEQAEVGVATVYNYFGTKGQLLADILRPDFKVLHDQSMELLARPPANPVTGILSLMDIYRHLQSNWDNRQVLLAVLGPGLSAEPVLDDLAAASEGHVKRQIEKLLSLYQDQKLIRAAIDITDAAIIIFYIFNQHFIEYITRKDADFDQMKQEMDRQISFIMTAILPFEQP
ncbi:hypothetical protein MNBD_ALPHA01-690 [hydrothermal vent metagenome]|uniref:HTH tetR-type domain-containing protein n=1 Tax=hydrothermal vent metagenome TaxID=652676 RepID=A0A3B0S519_9ZZZZ